MIDDKMDVGMDVGRLLDRFLIDVGTILGGKFAPSWHQNPQKEGTKTMSKKAWLKTHAGVREGRRRAARQTGVWVLKNN